jgi:catechol 2,3-dioxygenase-like lactoylglutathione lyase family enzyme
MASWHHVTVGVADLDTALALWVGKLGFAVLDERAGPDTGLAQLWSIQPEDISRQAMVHTPGEHHGMLHLVEFVDPDPPVRAGAQVYDLLPKNLDIHARDLPARFAELKASGEEFRNDSPSEITSPDGTRFREIHMKGHDETNIVMLEVIGEDLPYTDKGFAGLGPVITIVPSAADEKAFYVNMLGLDILSDNILKGPEIERMVGLPPGAGLDVSVLGHADEHFGRIEIVDYQGVAGENRYPRAKPKALGTLHVSYMTSDLASLGARLKGAGIAVTDYGPVTTLFGTGPAIAFASPAGLRIEAHQRD